MNNNKEVVLAAVQQYASDLIKKDKNMCLMSIRNNDNACKFFLLEGYKSFNEIVEKEGEDFLFSCCNNQIWKIRLQVANHQNFLPTPEQIAIGLKDFLDL